MKKIGLLLFVLSCFCSPLSADEYLINRGYILYVPKTEHIRAFIEPGITLQRIEVEYDERYRGRARVITPGGLIGEIPKGSYTDISRLKTQVAYLKHHLLIDQEQYNPGRIFKISVTESFQGTRYNVSCPVALYDFNKDSYYVTAMPVVYKEPEFFSNFNLIRPDAPVKNFPYWGEKESRSIEWGCSNSRTEKTVITVGAGGRVSGGGGFFKFFDAEVHLKNENEKTITYEKKLEDKENTHRLSFWTLYESYESRRPIFEIALEKISSCSEDKKFQYSYKIHFPKRNGIDPIIINKIWVDEHGLTPGGASPVGLKTLEDYKSFKNAITDFKFHYQLNDYDMDAVLLHLLMRFTTNISVEG